MKYLLTMLFLLTLGAPLFAQETPKEPAKEVKTEEKVDEKSKEDEMTDAGKKLFADIRGEGVWLGCELVEAYRGRAMEFVRAGHDAGLLLLVAGPDVLRLAPALTIGLDDIIEGLGRFEQALQKVAGQG